MVLQSLNLFKKTNQMEKMTKKINQNLQLVMKRKRKNLKMSKT